MSLTMRNEKEKTITEILEFFAPSLRKRSIVNFSLFTLSNSLLSVSSINFRRFYNFIRMRKYDFLLSVICAVLLYRTFYDVV